MFDKSTIEFLHSGCAVLIGTVDENGQPHASRGCGVTVLDAEAGRLRVLADGGDARLLANLLPGVLVAITVASVPTFYSMQMKGRVLGIEKATDIDEAKSRQYAADFTRDIHESDGQPMEVLARWAERTVVPCIVQIDSSFDQTPGPSAGAAMRSR